MAWDTYDTINTGLAIGSMLLGSDDPDVPTTEQFLKDSATGFTNAAGDIQTAGLAEIGVNDALNRQNITNQVNLYDDLGGEVSRVNAEQNARTISGNLQNVMGNTYDAGLSSAQNLSNLDRNANQELYGAANRISGMQYGGLGQMGGLYGESVNAGSRLVNNMVGRANEMVNRNGALSSRDLRDVNEMSRAGFNDRGRVRDSAAVVNEIANNEGLRMARRNEAWNYAGQAGGMEQGYNLANQGAINNMTSQNLNIANDRDQFNANLRNQDFNNQMQLNQMGYNAWSGLRQNPYGTLVQGQNPVSMSQMGNQRSGISMSDAGTANASIVGANIQNQQNRNQMWGNMAGGFLSNIGNG